MVITSLVKKKPNKISKTNKEPTILAQPKALSKDEKLFTTSDYVEANSINIVISTFLLEVGRHYKKGSVP